MAKNVYEMVTDRIIEELEKGVIPWKKNHGKIFLMVLITE